MRNQNDKRHKCSAESERHLPRHAERELAAYQVTGKSSAEQTPHSSGSARHPGKCADRFDIKAASIVEIFWKPEQVEKPSRIAQEFGGH